VDPVTVLSAEHHAAEVDAWRKRRYALLMEPISWLTLAGLDWLDDGENRLGTDPENEVVLQSGPPLAGMITVRDGEIVADAIAGGLRHDGGPVRRLPLATDAEGEPTLLELGELRLCVIERDGRLAVRTWDAASAARRAFAGIPHFPVGVRWRAVGRLEPGTGRTIRVPDVLGHVDDEASPGTVAFEINGATHRLEALPGGPDGEPWLVFGDATNGAETYAGGRFLYTPPPEPDGRVVIDFNRAYNPPCVFSPYATCPLPWPANRLPIRIEAGERALPNAPGH
jgi:uncharacterized protein (DUF1684 family)